MKFIDITFFVRYAEDKSKRIVSFKIDHMEKEARFFDVEEDSRSNVFFNVKTRLFSELTTTSLFLLGSSEPENFIREIHECNSCKVYHTEITRFLVKLLSSLLEWDKKVRNNIYHMRLENTPVKIIFFDSFSREEGKLELNDEAIEQIRGKGFIL